MPRPPDWPHRLAAVIEAARATPFALSQHDCPTFAFDTRRALTGEDAAALWRGRYRSYRGGLRLMRRLGWGSLAAMGDALLGAPLANPLLAQRGDIVLGPDGRGFGVCIGATAVGMAPEGLITVPLTTCTRLDQMARDWPTPMENDGCKPSAGNRRTADLTHASQMWMTPTARDHKDGATTLANTPVNGLLGRQVLVTPMAGSDTCDVRRTLNPLFVEALMGWPTGWTGFASVATAWSHWLQRMRCELWQLNCWPMDEVTA